VDRPVPEDIANYIYTSGTTGNPKGVLLTHSNLASNVSAALSVFPLVPQDRSLSFLPWAHAFGQTAELHTLIAAGASMGLCEAIPKLVDNLAEIQPTVLMSVPNIFMRIYDGVRKQMADKPGAIQWLFRTGIAAQGKLNHGQGAGLSERLALALAKPLIFSKIIARFGGRLRFAISGGAALPKEVAEFVDALGISVYEGYGLTETSPVAAANTPSARRLGSVGKPIPGVTIKLDHEASGSPEEGEIVVYGHNVMKGYYNLPDETQKVFTPDGGFRTGDLGKFDSDGFLFITGRIKELYKLDNGKYVAPGALENKLQLTPYIAQALVYGSNRPFNVAILVPNFVNLKEWAQAQGLGTEDIPKLLSDPKVRALFKKTIDEASKGFKGFEVIKDFYLAPEEFTVANDLLTPKLSMKRRNVIKRFEKEIDAVYAASPKGSKSAAA
jgi:long-chain acyl-CoA synthetase